MACELGLDGAQRVGAGNDDRVVLRFVIVTERQRLEAQHRRPQHLKTARLQAFGCYLVVGTRARNQNGHAFRPPPPRFRPYRMIALCDLTMLREEGNAPLTDSGKGLNWVTTRRCWCWVSRTTCDETAAAVVERQSDGSGRILSNIVRSQTFEHARFGGVVPEIAARAHVDLLDGIVGSAMREAGTGFAQLSAVAAAAGPGLIGGVIVGLTTAKAIAMVHDTPLIAVNHLEAHALTPRLTCALAFPYCLFLASGGHTQIVAVVGVGNYVRLGTTVDDAMGEAFDKVAKMLGAALSGRARGRACGRRRRCQTICISAADARTSRRQLLAIGVEDRGA